ncbi:sulfite exporter TauE/SafE family protein [Caenimonas soli]|uniref:sulfite exporter TauE/SafE family protein n=1 Tax=Caenimonas soli TaxID=2735555 RepID=UPI0015542C6E|nr:sulfite exporter TauE/SafE family protein [Caenimonas soli]NPC59129.1 sulfite exporter TauE/SafE family protein [Caenimonas soli]
MTREQLVVLALSVFAGGFAFGVTGFAYGVVASLFLHHVLPPREAVFFLVAGGLLLNLAALPRFWAEIQWKGCLPFLVGATFGIPVGLMLLTHLEPTTVRTLSSIVVVCYCAFALSRLEAAPLTFSPAWGRIADTGIGFAGGVLGGVAGLGPLLPSVWYGLRGKDKREARGLSQPFALHVQGLMVVWLLWTGSLKVTGVTSLLFAIPPMLLGAWLGLRLFDVLSPSRFRLAIVWLSLLGGIALLARQILASLGEL